MVVKRSAGEIVFDGFNVLMMLLLVFVTAYPFWYVVSASFSDALKLMQHQGFLILPLGFSTLAFQLVFTNPMIGTGYLNTLFLVVVGTLINIVLTSMSAYVVSRKQLMLRNGIMLAAVFTMYFGGGLIPFYLQVKALGLLGSMFAVILPTAISTFNLIILRTAFASIPESLEESARIDGANDLTIFARIMVPLALPSIAVIILYCAVGHWNGWFNAMLFLQKREQYPLQLILREILINNSTADMLTSVGGTDKEMIGESVKYATIVIATLPVLVVYPYLQKYFVKGIMIGAIKG